MPVGSTNDILKISQNKFDHPPWDVEIVSKKCWRAKIGNLESFKSIATVNHDVLFVLRIEAKHTQKKKLNPGKLFWFNNTYYKSL